MWLRDSSAQVMHYIRFADEPEVKELILQLIATQARCILADPYANAFNGEENCNHCHSHRDTPPRGARVWERKYELDSLCWAYYLAMRYLSQTGDKSFITPEFLSAARVAVDLFETETHHETSDYIFKREGKKCTLENDGHGKPAAYTGMIYSAFRPSDDKCMYGYPIYSNLFALKILEWLGGVFSDIGDSVYSDKCIALHDGAKRGIQEFGTVNHPVYGRIYAYEVDGFGNTLLMDDANMPSLLSLPVLDICAVDDELYQNTRRFILSGDNPYYFSGSIAKGVGSPHTPDRYVWHIALCTQLMTAGSETEKQGLLGYLAATHAGTKHMHESFDPDNPEAFTRPWFAWADSMFAEAALRLVEGV